MQTIFEIIEAFHASLMIQYPNEMLEILILIKIKKRI